MKKNSMARRYSSGGLKLTRASFVGETLSAAPVSHLGSGTDRQTDRQTDKQTYRLTEYYVNPRIDSQYYGVSHKNDFLFTPEGWKYDSKFNSIYQGLSPWAAGGLIIESKHDSQDFVIQICSTDCW